MGCAQGKVEDASRYDHPGHGAHHHGSANHGHHNSSNHGHHGDDHMTWHEVPGAVKEYEEKQKHKHDNRHNSSNRGHHDVHIDHAHHVNRDIAQKLLHDVHTSNHKGYDAADSLRHHDHHDSHSGKHRRDSHGEAHHDNHSGKHHDTHDNHDANDKDEVAHPVDNSSIKSPTFFGGHPNQRRGSQSHAEEEGEEHQIFNVHHSNRKDVHVRHHEENDHNILHQSLNKDLSEQDLEDYIKKHGMPTGGKHRSRHSHMHAHV